jgi:hypothetical protein
LNNEGSENMSKPKVVEYIKNRYQMRNKTLAQIVNERKKRGESEIHILYQVLGFLMEYDELD